MKRGTADLPLHYGTVPPWLAERMSLLGGAIAEAIIIEYGRPALLQRLSDPFWFQSLGCVLGMDWHSSGITTSVMNALRKAINCRSEELGVYICGGRGKFSRETPNQLLEVANKTSLLHFVVGLYFRLAEIMHLPISGSGLKTPQERLATYQTRLLLGSGLQFQSKKATPSSLVLVLTQALEILSSFVTNRLNNFASGGAAC